MPLIPYPATDAEMANLAKYKYSGKDYSLSSKYFMTTWWELVLRLIPKTIAPNMLTLIGFLFSSSTTLLLMGFALFADGVVPNWLWLWAALSLFGYQTMDAIDGKQARRTGCGSPLGELFDHGCDALFTPFLNVWICLAQGYSPMESFLFCFCVNTGLFLSLFEQFSTGTLDLGFINGPVEGILISVGCFAWTSVVGPAWWATPFVGGPLLPLDAWTNGLLPFSVTKPNDFTLCLAVVSATFTGITNVYHAVTLPKAHKGVSRASVFLPMLLVAGLAGGVPLRLPHLLMGPFPFAMEVSYGLLVSYTVTRMTIARLVMGAYNPFSGPYRALLGALLLVHMIPSFSEAGTMPNRTLLTLPVASSAIFSLMMYARLALGTFAQFARHLRVNILTMTREQLARNR